MPERAELYLHTSGWEKFNSALWRRDGSEIGHIHRKDGSLHVVLTTADAALVVRRL